MKHTGDILVSSERSCDSGLVGKDDLVGRVRREEALKKSNCRVEDDSSLNTGLDADLHLVVVDEVRADSLNVRRRPAVEVGGADEATEDVRLDLVHFLVKYAPERSENTYLSESGGLRVRRLVGVWVLVQVVAIAIPGNDDDTENL